MEPAEEERQKQESPYMHPIRFLIRSDELLNPNYGRSAIGAERSILIPIYIILPPSFQTYCRRQYLSIGKFHSLLEPGRDIDRFSLSSNVEPVSAVEPKK